MVSFSWSIKSTVEGCQKTLPDGGRKRRMNYWKSGTKPKGWALTTSQSYGFSSSHVRMWELDHKEGWIPKNWCFRTVVLAMTLESPLDCKEIQPVNPKGNQPWLFIGRTDAEAEAPVLWPPAAESQLTGKYPDTGKDFGQEKRVTEDEMIGWHHQLNEHESAQTHGFELLSFEQIQGDGEGQGNLACCSPWGRKSWKQLSDWTTI